MLAYQLTMINNTKSPTVSEYKFFFPLKSMHYYIHAMGTTYIHYMHNHTITNILVSCPGNF